MLLSDFIARSGQAVRLAKSAHVFHQGDASARIYFVAEGALKAYYLDPEGRERIKSFFGPGDIAGSLLAAANGEQCPFGLVCLGPCRLAAVEFDAIRKAASADAALAAGAIEALISLSIKKERRERELLCLSPSARYEELRRRSPELLQAIAQKDIALYLGITPVALSRIRRRLAAPPGG